jgi:hypothetical protein
MKPKIHLLSNARHGSSYMWHVLSKYHSPASLVTPMSDDLDSGMSRRLFNETFSRDGHRYHNNLTNQQIQHNFTLISQTDRYVMKTHSYELDVLAKCNLLEDFKNIDHYRIMLLRRNIFESTLSTAISRIKNQWTNHTNTDSMTVPLENFSEAFEFQWNMTQELVTNKYNLSYDETIYFEDLTFWPRKDFCNTKLCNQDLDTLIKVHIRDNLYHAPNKYEIVINYNELYDYCLKLISLKSCNFGKFNETTLL